jgi:hypothetical protein
VVRVHGDPTTSSTIVVVEDEDRAVDNPTPDDCEHGLAEARDLAQKIVLAEGNPMQLANAIYWAGWNNGGFAGPSADPICPELNEVAAEFVQLAYELETHPIDSEAGRAYVALTREAAEAFLEGRPLPEWFDAGGGPVQERWDRS